MAQTQAVFTVQNVAETHLTQIMAALFVMPALSQFIARVVAGDIGVEVGRIVGEQSSAHHLLSFPQIQQTQLGAIQRIVVGCQWIQVFGQNLFKSVPEGLRGEAFRRNSPERMQDGSPYQSATSGLGPGLTDAVDGGQQ